MWKVVSSLLVATVPCATIAAQAAPGVITTVHQNPILTFGTGGNVPAGNCNHITTIRVRDSSLTRFVDRPGVWTIAITAQALDAKYGGKNQTDALLGTYDRVAKKYTPNNLAAALNTSGEDSYFAIDPTGMYAIVDRNDGFYLSKRASLTQPFPAPAKIQGMTASFVKVYAEGALGYQGGKLQLIWQEGPIYMAALDTTNMSAPRVAPSSTWRPLTAQQTAVQSPVPIHGPDGDVEGLWLELLPGGFNADGAWVNDLDPTTPPLPVLDVAGYIDGGGVAGSELMGTDRSNAKGPIQVEAAWLLGDEEVIGGTADIFGVAKKAGFNPVTTVVLFAANPIKPIPIPGIGGEFALDLLTMQTLGVLAHTDASEMGSMSFPIPNQKIFSGLNLALQGLSIDTVQKTLVFTNTAWLRIQ